MLARALESYICALNGANPDHVAPLVNAARALVRSLSSASCFDDVGRVIQLMVQRAEQAGGWSVLYPPDSCEGEWLAKMTYNAAVAALEKKLLGPAATLFDMAAHVCAWQPVTAALSPLARKLAAQCFLDHLEGTGGAAAPEKLERLDQHLRVLRASDAGPDVVMLEFRAAIAKVGAWTCGKEADTHRRVHSERFCARARRYGAKCRRLHRWLARFV